MTATFLQRDLREAIKAAKNAGLDMDKTGFKVDKNGTITVVPMAGGEEPSDAKGADEWERRMRKLGLVP
jgi:hypothetical protein